MSAARRRTSSSSGTGTRRRPVLPERTRAPRRLDIVRVRLLNSGPNPVVGLTLPSSVLSVCGLNIGDRVYVVLEEEGRLLVMRADGDVAGVRARERPAPVLLTPLEKRVVYEELSERVGVLEAEAMEQQKTGTRKTARLRLGRADRLLGLIRKFDSDGKRGAR